MWVKLTKDTPRHPNIDQRSRSYYGQECTQHVVSWWYTNKPKFGVPMSKSKDILPDSNPWWKYNFDIEVKGQGHAEFMNVRNTSYHGDTLKCQTKYNYVKGQKS